MLTTEEIDSRLETAHLRYVDTSRPGYTRKKRGKGFTYFDQHGKPITDQKTKARIESLVIPPAWKDVWISPSANGHIQAVGRDDRGRKQYIYHPRWQETANESKFSSLIAFGEALPELRKTLHEHLRDRGLTRRKVLALVVTLLEQTLIRIGNYEYARTNDTYGLTTLTDDHVSVNGAKITFDFVGKSGVTHKVTIKDKRLAALVKACQDLPGYDLFQYIDENGVTHSIGSADVNAYLMELTGSAFTAKVFRTWGGSSLMTDILCNMPPVTTKKEREKQVREGIKQVAAGLQNTIPVCKKYYVHPAVVEAHLSDELTSFYRQKSASKNPFSLTTCENALLQLLKSS